MRKQLLLILTVVLLSVCLPSQAQTVQQLPPSVPEYVEFAGQKIKFDRADLRERMDRELIAFTYSHNMSTLMIKRANRLFPEIEPILKRMGVPDDFKYLMVIESNLDPQAVSGAGAAGLWQFTQSTGREYGLEVNSNIDERYNTVKATEAACKFLLKAYGKYQNWMTVAASYNAGQGGISKRLENQKQRSALELWLPEETARYMFRLLAVKMFFEDPQSFGFNVPFSDRYPYVEPRDIVTVNYPIPSLVDFALEHGTTYARLKEANLWLRDDKLTNKSNKTYRIILP